MINGVSHVGIGVRDLEKSLKFYRDLLGLVVRSDKVQPIDGMPQLYVNPEKGPRRAVYLHYGSGQPGGFLVIAEVPKGESPGTAIKFDEVGVGHVSHCMKSSKPRASHS